MLILHFLLTFLKLNIISFTLDKISTYLLLIRADKPIGTLLLAYPVLWSFWISYSSTPPAFYVFIFLIGAFLMRSAGCIINDIADYKFDRRVERTKDRPLASDNITLLEAKILFISFIICALILVFLLPKSTLPFVFLSFFSAIIYPFSKRFFIIPQLFLGIAYASAVLMVFSLKRDFTLVSILIFTVTVIWALIYDSFYAMVDKDDDIKLPINSSALYFNKNTKFFIKIMMVLMLFILTLVGFLESFNIYYYLISILGCFFCFFFQTWITRKNTRDSYFVAFINNQWCGLLIFTGIVINYLP